MAKVKGPTVVIEGVLKSVSSQTIQYKPFGYELDLSGELGGDKVVLRLEVPENLVTKKQGCVILDMAGFRAVLVQMAREIDKVDSEYKHAVTGG